MPTRIEWLGRKRGLGEEERKGRWKRRIGRRGIRKEDENRRGEERIVKEEGREGR